MSGGGDRFGGCGGTVALFNRDLWAMRARIAAATGLHPRPALASAEGAAAVGVWGRGRAWPRACARRAGAALIHLEDAFLRSPTPGRGALTVGLIADPEGWHGDPSNPGRLPRLIDRRAALGGGAGAEVAELLLRLRLSKYAAHGRSPWLPERAVVVADQVPGDAALAAAPPDLFPRILRAALAEDPALPVLIRPHPAVPEGHLSAAALLRLARHDAAIAAALRQGRLRRLPPGVPPHLLFARTARLHVANSLLGLEALVHGVPVTAHAPSFYSGRGLTEDRHEAPPRRPASLHAILAAAYLDHCTWFEPGDARPAPFHVAAEALHRLVRSGPPPTRPRPSRIGFLLAAGGAA